MSATKVNVGWALEGTVTGALHRQKFANHVATLEGYQTLLSYLTHDATCAKRRETDLYLSTGDEADKRCDCGLAKLLNTGSAQ